MDDRKQALKLHYKEHKTEKPKINFSERSSINHTIDVAKDNIYPAGFAIKSSKQTSRIGQVKDNTWP